MTDKFSAEDEADHVSVIVNMDARLTFGVAACFLVNRQEVFVIRGSGGAHKKQVRIFESPGASWGNTMKVCRSTFENQFTKPRLRKTHVYFASRRLPLHHSMWTKIWSAVRPC